MKKSSLLNIDDVYVQDESRNFALLPVDSVYGHTLL